MERYLQVQWGKHIFFRDSLQFLTSSLDQLVQSLAKSGDDKFHHLEQVVPLRYPDTNVDLLKRKGIFSYDYIDSLERLTENALPARELFSSRLSGTECSPKDYEHAKQVWKEFQSQTLEEYMELYLLCDVYLLADVFEQFRTTSLEVYQLDPAYFVSILQLALSALLQYINRLIYLICDPEMYRMIQPLIRGGICHASVRYAKANNKLMGSLYDPTKPTSYIMYVDANNLYGWALSQAVPEKDYEWLSDDECRDAERALQIKEMRDLYFKHDRHYIFEVDLDYPPELHDCDDDYPLAPETMTIDALMVNGEKQVQLRAKYYGSACLFSRKLVCSFLPKRHYVVLGYLLRFYLDRGMRLVCIHRGIKFSASSLFQPYIAHNSEMRQ